MEDDVDSLLKSLDQIDADFSAVAGLLKKMLIELEITDTDPVAIEATAPLLWSLISSARR
jgi:hypothetical protein